MILIGLIIQARVIRKLLGAEMLTRRTSIILINLNCHSNKLTFASLEKNHHHSAFMYHADPMQHESNNMG